MRVLILATDIFTRGGIARYTHTLATALGQLLGGATNVDLLPLIDDPARRFAPSHYRILSATTAKLSATQKAKHVARGLWHAGSNYDLVFCTHVGLAPIAAIIGRLYGTPYLVVCYGSEVWDRLPLLNRAALKRASLVLADSRFTADALEETNRIAKARVRLLLNAIPDELVRQLVNQDSGELSDPRQPASSVDIFAARSVPTDAVRVPIQLKPRYPQTEGPALLSVGSLKPEHAYKGVDTVIEALPRVLQEVPGVRYLVIGDGSNRGNLELFAARRGVAGNVIFRGEVNDAQLAEAYRACDVFVLPSRATHGGSSGGGRAEGEGFGRVYVEAALAGKPVVGSRDGGAAEAVLHGRTGLLVDPRSAGQVAEAVLELLRAPERAAAMGAEGRRWALENFTIDVMRSQLKQILASVFSSHSLPFSIASPALP